MTRKIMTCRDSGDLKSNLNFKECLYKIKVNVERLLFQCLDLYDS